MTYQVYWYFEGTRTVAFYDIVENVDSSYTVEDYKYEYASNNSAEELEGYRIEMVNIAG